MQKNKTKKQPPLRGWKVKGPFVCARNVETLIGHPFFGHPLDELFMHTPSLGDM